MLFQLDSYSKTELERMFEKYGVKAPVSGNPLSPPVEFNLMFPTSIGPGNGLPGYVCHGRQYYDYGWCLLSFAGFCDQRLRREYL